MTQVERATTAAALRESEELPMTAERDAQGVLRTTWSEGSPNLRIPVDPIKIARRLGLKVFVAPMTPDVSGALLNKHGQDATIYLNEQDSHNRQRFTCAHELGHYVRRTDAGELDYEYVDRRDQLATAGTNADEIYANQFAAALLMPAEMLRALHRRFQPVELAYKFGVSADAMNFRIVNLDLTRVHR